MMILKLFLMMSSAFSGGHTVANGGNVVMCKSADLPSDVFYKQAAFYDIFQYHIAFNYTYKKLASYRNQDFESAFPKAVKALFARSPFYQDLLLKHFAKRAQEVKVVNRALPQIPMVSWQAFVRGCNIAQAAVQYNNLIRSPSDPLHIEIDSDYWTGPERLPVDQKIALLIHEYIFGIQFNVGSTCAYSHIYEVIGTLLSDQAAHLTYGEWNNLLEFDCPIYE